MVMNLHKNKVLVLGAGAVGTTMVFDLAESDENQITVVDCSPIALAQFQNLANVTAIDFDVNRLSGISLTKLGSFDLVFGALPSWLGLEAMKAVIDAKIPYYIDVSFMEENAITLLDKKAKKNGVTCIMDCGVAPGLSNIIAARVIQKLEGCKYVTIYAGGLPVNRNSGFLNYKAGFSAYDVIELYTRPSRVLENGKIAFKEALSDVEMVSIPGVDCPLEALTTDGLRSLLDTVSDNVTVYEKTLRYPGHFQAISVLRNVGLFSKNQIALKNGVAVRPIDVAAKLLFPLWQFDVGEKDFTVLYVVAEDENRKVLGDWSFVDEGRDGIRSLPRTTAFPATIAGQLLVNKETKLTCGVHAPEALAYEEYGFSQLLKGLQSKGILYVSSCRL
jgi:saccharopine dehydrogenase-like NADP-dependent oxidoreductase